MMQNDIHYVLNGLLADWHIWSQHTHARSGLPGKAAGFGQSKSNSQYDWEAGIESDLVDKRIMEGFDGAAERIRRTDIDANTVYYVALCFEARNLAVRYQVWSSPRLPADRAEREALIGEARTRLLRELERDGVLC